MAGMKQKRDEAKRAGVPVSEIRSAESVAEIDKLIRSYSKPAPRTVAKKKAPVKKRTVRSTPTRKAPTRKATVAKSGRSTSRPAVNKSKGKAKRPTSVQSDDLKRNLLDGVNFSETDGWNPREGSAPDRIIKALKRAKGNRSRAFDILLADLWDFVGKRKQDGSKRTKADAEAMLRYRISRTAWDFALKTLQHETAEGRVEYGTGGTGEGVWKPKNGNKKVQGRTTSQTRKPAAKKSTTTTRKPATRKPVARKPVRKPARRTRR